MVATVELKSRHAKSWRAICANSWASTDRSSCSSQLRQLAGKRSSGFHQPITAALDSCGASAIRQFDTLRGVSFNSSNIRLMRWLLTNLQFCRTRFTCSTEEARRVAPTKTSKTTNQPIGRRIELGCENDRRRFESEFRRFRIDANSC